MEIHACDENKLIDIWLTNAEKDSSRLIDSLKPLYQTYRNLNYTVAVFKSGSQDLYRQTSDLLCHNRKRLAELEVQQAKQCGGTHLSSPA